MDRRSGIVALLTDFGTRDPYVGAMKGVILSVNPRARVVDLSHEVPPQDVLSAYFFLENSHAYFPPGTVFVAVVDPGVGTGRRILCARSERHLFLAPDNGLLTFLERGGELRAMHEVTQERYFLRPVSNTFHGRDIFAPVAGRLSKGLPPARLGKRINDWVHLSAPDARVAPGAAVGKVVSIDRFGNLITNLPGHVLHGAARVFVGDRPVWRIVTTYAEGRAGELVALVGSAGTVEIALPQGSAAEETAAAVGETVRVEAKPR